MNRAIRVLAPVLVVAAVAALGPAARAAETIRVPLAPGAELVQTLIGAAEPGGPQMIHAVIVDPRAQGIRLAAALGGDTVEEQPGNGMEAVTRLVARTGALAGINADFFPFTGDPLGLAIHQGEFLSEPLNGRGAIGFLPDGHILVGRPTFSGNVVAEDGATTKLSGANRKGGENDLILYAPVYGATTPDKAATVVTLDAPGQRLSLSAPLKATVRSFSEATGAVPIPKDGFLLCGTGNAADWLRVHAVAGKALTIGLSVSEPGKDWSKATEAVAGGPVLLTAGKEDLQLQAEGIGNDFSTTRHPRSAVGVTKDGKVILLAVDGRQALSRGMSLPELSATMQGLGAVDALNLDGGGSTCLSVLGLAINSPSDGVVRRVADSLLVFAGTPKDVSAGPLNPNAPIRVTAGAPPIVAPNLPATGTCLWGTENGGAFVDQKGRIYGYKGGPAKVESMPAPLGGTGTVAVWPVDVLPGPAGKVLTAWKDGTLEITVRDVNNNPVAGQEVELKKPDGTMTEVTTGADGKARAPKGWLPDETAPVTLTSGPMTAQWPKNAPKG